MWFLQRLSGLSTFRAVRLCSKHARVFSTTQRKLDDRTDSLYDVVISGGGMVGAAMATAIGYEDVLKGKKVLLLEAGTPKRFSKPPEKFNSRTCALSPSTVDLLSGFGAWEKICDMRCQEVKRMQVWDSCSDSLLTFNHEDLTDNLAYIAENEIILNAIYEQLENVADTVSVKYETQVESYKLPHMRGTTEDKHGHTPWAQVKLNNGETIDARLLIGADGFRSLLRKTAHFHTIKWNYDQFALVATLHLPEDMENNVAWQRFLPTGPIALLPLSPKYSCLIWTTSPDNAKRLLQMSPETFVDAVNNAFWTNDDKDPIVGNANQLLDNVLTTLGLDGSSSQQLPPTILDVDEGSRGMFPLGLCHSTQYVSSRVALIGDAAHRMHPLAGQGVNAGFGDVACLRDQLVKAVSDGMDIGSLQYLLEYETQRQRHVLPTMFTVDGLNKLYSSSWTPLVLMRSLGLQATNALGPIKSKMMEHAAT